MSKQRLGSLSLSLFLFACSDPSPQGTGSQVDLPSDQVVLSGQVQTIFEDYHDEGRSLHYPVLKVTEDGSERLVRVEGVGDLASGSHVVLRGQLKGGRFHVDSVEEAPLLLSEPQSLEDSKQALGLSEQVAQAPQVYKAVVIPVNFSDNKHSRSNAEIKKLFEDNFAPGKTYGAVEFYKTMTSGEVNLEMVYRNKVTIAASGKDCDPYTWSSQAAKKLRDRDGNVSGAHMIYYLASNGCSFSGLGSLPGGTVWLNSGRSGGSLAVLIHELGHNYGMHHASRNGSEYGDRSDEMGSGALVGFNAPHMEEQFWLNESAAQVVTADGTYLIDSLEKRRATTKTQMIKVATSRGGREYYYFSYRTRIGDYVPSSTLDRVSVHKAHERTTAKTDLLGELAPGQTWNQDGVEATFLGVKNGMAEVKIDMGVEDLCERGDVTFEVQPLNRTVEKGKQAEFTATVTNNDSVECPQSTFDFVTSFSGQSGFYRKSAGIAPGKSRIISLRFTVNYDPGTYTANFSVGNGFSSSSARGSLTVSGGVEPPKPPEPPVDSIDPRGEFTGYTSAYSALHGYVCDKKDFDRKLKVRLTVGGKNYTYTANTQRGPSDAAKCGGRARHGFVHPVRLAPGHYTARVRVLNPDGSVHSTLGTKSFTVAAKPFSPKGHVSGYSSAYQLFGGFVCDVNDTSKKLKVRVTLNGVPYTLSAEHKRGAFATASCGGSPKHGFKLFLRGHRAGNYEAKVEVLSPNGQVHSSMGTHRFRIGN